MTKPILPTATISWTKYFGGEGLQPPSRPVLLPSPYQGELRNMIAYQNRSNTSCTHPPQPTLGCPPSHIPQCATHPAMHSRHIHLLALLFGSLSSTPAIVHVQFAFHKSQETRVCKNVSSKNKGRCRDGAVCLKGIENHLAEKP